MPHLYTVSLSKDAGTVLSHTYKLNTGQSEYYRGQGACPLTHTDLLKFHAVLLLPISVICGIVVGIGGTLAIGCVIVFKTMRVRLLTRSNGIMGLVRQSKAVLPFATAWLTPRTIAESVWGPQPNATTRGDSVHLDLAHTLRKTPLKGSGKSPASADVISLSDSARAGQGTLLPSAHRCPASPKCFCMCCYLDFACQG